MKDKGVPNVLLIQGRAPRSELQKKWRMAKESRQVLASTAHFPQLKWRMYRASRLPFIHRTKRIEYQRRTSIVGLLGWVVAEESWPWVLARLSL